MCDYPPHWRIKRLHQITSKIGSGITPKGGRNSYLDQGIPLIRSQNVLVGALDLKDVAFISVEQHNVMATTKLRSRDVLLNITGASIGRSCVFPDGIPEANVNQHVCIIRPTEAIDSDFLCSFLNSDVGQKQIYSFQAGGNRQGLNFEQLSVFEIPLPPLLEQGKIAEILRTWDEAIATVEQLIGALQRRKKGLMQRLLTGQVRFPEFGGAEWEEVELGQFLSHTPRKVPKPSEPYKRMGIRSHGKGTFTEIVEDPGSNAMDHLYTVKGDDFIVNITFAWEQAIAIVLPDDEGSLVSHRFPTYEFNRSKVVPEFFRYLMLTKRFLYQLDLITPGGAGRNRVMSKTDFLKLQVTIPPVEEQKLIGAVLSAADKEINTFQEYLRCLKDQKKGLMQRLLTGQVRVQV